MKNDILFVVTYLCAYQQCDCKFIEAQRRYSSVEYPLVRAIRTELTFAIGYRDSYG